MPAPPRPVFVHALLIAVKGSDGSFQLLTVRVEVDLGHKQGTLSRRADDAPALREEQRQICQLGSRDRKTENRRLSRPSRARRCCLALGRSRRR